MSASDSTAPIPSDKPTAGPSTTTAYNRSGKPAKPYPEFPPSSP